MNLILHHKRFVICLLLGTSMAFVTSCEKDVDNTIPAEAPRLDAFKKDFKEALIKEQNNHKIWLTSPLTFVNQYNDLFESWDYPVTPFFVAFAFKPDNTVQIYVTIRHDRYQTSSADTITDIVDNPNTYRIGGDLRVELTFLNKGILSSLKEESIFDFDFYLNSHNQQTQEVNLISYYNKTSNNFVKIFPFDLDKFQLFSKACRYIYNASDNYNTTIIARNPYTQEYPQKLTLKKGDSAIFENESLVGYFLPNFLLQHYDEQRGILCLQTREESSFSAIFFNSYDTLAQRLIAENIKYFVVRSVSKEKIIFDSYSPDFTEIANVQLIIDL